MDGGESAKLKSLGLGIFSIGLGIFSIGLGIFSIEEANVSVNDNVAHDYALAA